SSHRRRYDYGRVGRSAGGGRACRRQRAQKRQQIGLSHSIRYGLPVRARECACGGHGHRSGDRRGSSVRDHEVSPGSGLGRQGLRRRAGQTRLSPGQQSLEHVARDTAYRGLADAIIVTGSGTGQPTEMEDLVRVKETVPDIPVLVGSGVEQENVARFLSVADGVIVGTSVKESVLTTNPVDKARVERLVAAVRAIR
ncbi:MAG TPA: hypothetical protein ENO24_04125, partial [Chloroflexi bacterium]|nr:hypothetical protein [Chloroflexota bacterium]